MAKIRVHQPKEEHIAKVKHILDVEEQNPNEEFLKQYYVCVFETDEIALPDAYMEEDILLDSVEGMVNASKQKLRDIGAYDVIEVHNKAKKTQILLLEDDEYEIIED
ncbi:MAG: hypothetical protein ACE3JP_15470 [Ectobacillus sp.]